MKFTEDQLRELLVKTGAVTEEEWTQAKAAKEAVELGVERVLVSSGVITNDQLGQLLALGYKVPYVDFKRTHVPAEIVQVLPESFARAHQLIPINVEEQAVTVATAAPDALAIRALLEKYLRKKVKFAYATEADIKSHMYFFQKDPKEMIQSIIDTAKALPAGIDTTAIQLVDTMIDYAYQGGASDIHVEAEEDHSMIRFRQDGILHDIAKVPKSFHDNIMTRLKVLSRLATDERRAAQDGKIRHTTHWGEGVEVRLSIIPTTHAEKAVMRLLADRSQELTLANLGLSNEDYRKASDAIAKPWGMILVTGPTGSGKSTTLYAMLKVLNSREVNITTIEDPVEFDMEGVNQIQVNEKAGLTFAKGLRSIVRQDPDIVMVGEIRDSETAKIAVNAAMTGHLVLSTLHTNDSATSFPRLSDMGVEDFLIASTVNIIIAQRLVRKICMNCIASSEPSVVEQELIDRVPTVKEYFAALVGKKDIKKARLFSGKGCHVCHQTGYHGRVGIFEMLAISDAIRTAVMQKQNAEQLEQIAIKDGMTTMLYDGLRKTLTGLTTLEEVLRVTRE